MWTSENQTRKRKLLTLFPQSSWQVHFQCFPLSLSLSLSSARFLIYKVCSETVKYMNSKVQSEILSETKRREDERKAPEVDRDEVKGWRWSLRGEKKAGVTELETTRFTVQSTSKKRTTFLISKALDLWFENLSWGEIRDIHPFITASPPLFSFLSLSFGSILLEYWVAGFQTQ